MIVYSLRILKINYILYNTGTPMNYRPEIDGLRAFAVIPVILYHAGFSVFSGGFIGVDVFFVISGYLITTILINDIDNQNFSIIKFYERRAKRILPALFVVILFSIIAGIFVFSEEQSEAFTSSVFAALLSYSNVFFWLESGYFETNTLVKPLLHTWSLGIEEQYYVLFPILLFIIWRFGYKISLVAIGYLTFVSLSIGVWAVKQYPDATFFLLHTRAWELLFGSITSIIVLKFNIKSNNVLSLIGMTALLFSVFYFNKETPHPGIHTLIPVIGTVLIIIFTNNETLIARILSLKIFVFIGLISYSAYLWHQPIMAFTRLAIFKSELPLKFQLLTIASTVLFAYLSWRYIEKPCRSKRFATSRRSLFVIFTSSGIAIYLFAYLVTNNSLYRAEIIRHTTGEYSTNIIRGDKAINYLNIEDNPLWDNARVNVVSPQVINKDCLILAIGDSHTAHLRHGFSYVMADKYGCEIHILASNHCPLLLDYISVGIRKSENLTIEQRDCADLNKLRHEYVLNNIKQYSHVILSNRWNYLVGGEKYEDRMVRQNSLVKNIEEDITPRNRVENLSDALSATIKYYLSNGLKVILFSQPPMQLYDMRDFDITTFHDKARPSYTEAKIRQDNFDEVIKMSKLDLLPNFYYLNSFNFFCPDIKGRCLNRLSNYSFYSDDDHLSDFGSETIGKLLIEKFPNAFEAIK